MAARNKRWFRMPDDVRREVMRLAAQGLSYSQIQERVDISQGGVGLVLRPLGGVIRKDMLAPTGRRLSLAERVEIRVALERGWSYRRIGAELGRSGSTVCREVAAGGGRGGYRPVAAHERAVAAARRPKVTKLAGSPALRAEVIAGLQRLWCRSRLPARCAGAQMRAWELCRTRRSTRACTCRGGVSCAASWPPACGPGGRPAGRGQAGNPRPDHRHDQHQPAAGRGRRPGRARPLGRHLIVGKDGKSYIATLVERSTRYVMLARVTDSRAETVAAALAGRAAELPAQLWRSLTWDQGHELAGHARFTVATGIPVYFCDPHSPWQRGSNENTNGLLRQYFPKGTSLRGYTQDHLDQVAIQLNGRPRATLNWETPAERLAPLLVATTG